jgi:hypothetical protein
MNVLEPQKTSRTGAKIQRERERERERERYISVCISLEASVTEMELFVESFKDTFFFELVRYQKHLHVIEFLYYIHSEQDC